MKNIVDIAKRIAEFGGETFYVGGYVRDKFLNKPNKDIDVEIYNITPEQLKEVLSEFGEVQTIGNSFGIYNVKGYDIDFALPRSEKATGRGHKDFEVFVDPFISKEKACKRRDFTMNALMENVLTGEVLDFFGGVEDINNKVIRHVSDDTFTEDPLRVLRACQFASRFDFAIAENTIRLASNVDLSYLPKERVFEELKKALVKSNKPSIFFDSLLAMGHTEMFPELYRLIGIGQSEKYHPEGDVYRHTMCVVDCISGKSLLLSLSALCHDMGKYETFTTDEEGNVHFINHEKALETVDAFLNRLTNDKDIHKYVLDMTRNHMRIHQSLKSKKVKTWNRVFDESVAPRDLIELSFADTLNKDEFEFNTALKHYRHYLAWVNVKQEITGKDLVTLGFEPSPVFSEILAYAHDLWLAEVQKECVIKSIKAEWITRKHPSKSTTKHVNDLMDKRLTK